MIRAFVGAGGKTTLIHEQAAQYRAEGKRVFVTTSTHMFIEPDTVLSDDPDVILAQLYRTGYVMAGIPEGEKIRSLSSETYERVCSYADVVLLVLDMSRPLSAEDESLLRTLHGRNGCIVLNKSDLPPVLTESDLQDAADGKPILTVSASVPDSLQPLKSYLASQAAVSDQLTLTQPRHIAAARRAVAALHQAEDTLRSYSVDLAGVDLQQAQMALAEITGDEVEEKLLDEVFGRFCVGK